MRPRIAYRPMSLRDHRRAVALWRRTEGMCVTADDRRAGIALYLRRNRGLCFVATSAGKLVGTVLCGHDGRRGILRHLAVDKRFRGKGIARRLVDLSLRALTRQGVARCNLFVMDTNPSAMAFWLHLGFKPLDDDYRTLQGAARGSLPG